MRKAIIAIGVAASLAACTLSLEQQTAVAKAYDKTCAAEPPIYQSFVTIATAKRARESTMQKAAAIHATVAELCETRPADLATASVTLANLYAQLVLIAAQVERLPTPATGEM